MPTPVSLTLDKALSLLTLVVADAGESSLAELAEQANLPPSTAHRILATFQRRGFISRVQRGCYLPGPALMRLGRADDFHSVLRRVGTSVVASLARTTGLTVNLGVLQDDMVTFLVTRRGSSGSTREGTQLEAYCSAVGKALLAGLSEQEIQIYLSTGPLIRLTKNTIIDPKELYLTLINVRKMGHALDNGELVDGLTCIAVPIRNDTGNVCAALSVSKLPHSNDLTQLHTSLSDAAHRIEARLAPLRSADRTQSLEV